VLPGLGKRQLSPASRRVRGTTPDGTTGLRIRDGQTPPLWTKIRTKETMSFNPLYGLLHATFGVVERAIGSIDSTNP